MTNYTIKATDGKWRLYYASPKAQPCFDGGKKYGNGLVFSQKLSWSEKWKIESYLKQLEK